MKSEESSFVDNDDANSIVMMMLKVVFNWIRNRNQHQRTWWFGYQGENHRNILIYETEKEIGQQTWNWVRSSRGEVPKASNKGNWRN